MYLYRIELELYSYHKPLETIYSSRSKPSARIEQWILRLQPNRFTVQYYYLPGDQSIAASISCLPQAENKAGPSAAHKVSDEFSRFVAVTTTPRTMMTHKIEEVSAEDEEFSELSHRIKSGTWRDGHLKQYDMQSIQIWFQVTEC